LDSFTFIAILAAAAMHAGWNVIVKINLDAFLGIALVTIAAGIVSLPAFAVVEVPRLEAWPWLIASVILHVGYNVFLVRAYRFGDLGQVYPVARGTAPLLTAVGGIALVGEHIGLVTAVGILVLCSGVWLMSLSGRKNAGLGQNAMVMALVTSLFISGYSLTDGIGARANGSPHGYAVWLFVLDGLVMSVMLLASRGRQGLAVVQHWRQGLAGGAMSLAAYWIAIWAMTKAPIALVAALRESSVLFAAVFSIVFLGEPLWKSRAIAAVLIACGVALVRLA
jgi:drug/metabolite transporter (DMT)-like permease